MRELDQPDIFGVVEKSINAHGEETLYEHTIDGRLNKIIHPDKTTETLLTNAQNHLLQHTVANGNSRQRHTGLDGRALVERNEDDTILEYTYQIETGEILENQICGWHHE